MPYKDPLKQKEYQREWQRSQKAGEPLKPLARTLNPAEMRTAEGILNVLSDILSQLLAAKGDLYMKARTITYVASVGLKAVETAELERRLNELENKLSSGGNNGDKRPN